VTALTLTACLSVPEEIQPMATEATQRKDRSESILKAEGMPIYEHLPVIESEQEAKRRAKEEVAYRAAALLAVALKGEGLEQPLVEDLVKRYELDPHLTPKERAFLREATPTQHDRIQFAWRYEAAWTLLWALGYVETLEKPVALCDVPKAVTYIRDKSAKQFIADAKLRPLPEILDQADRSYRYHWAVVNAQVNQKDPPAGLEAGVTLERLTH
jgi:hypothetical protein